MSKNYTVRLESFDVSGYRSCVRTHVDLNVDLSALIGINGSGKTNVLHSLLLLKKLVNIKPFFRHRREEKKSSVCEMRVVFRVGDARVSYLALINYVTNEINADEIVSADENWEVVFPDGRVGRSEFPLSLLRLPSQESTWMFAENISWKERQKNPSLPIQEIAEIASRIAGEMADPAFKPMLDEVARFVSKMNYYSASQFTNPSDCPPFFELESEGLSPRRYGYARGSSHTRFLRDLYSLREKNKTGFEEYSSLVGKEGINLVDRIDFHSVDLPSSDIELQSGGKIVKTKVRRTLIVPHFVIHGAKLSPAQLSEGTFKTLAVLLYLCTDKSDLLLLEEPEVCIHHGLLCSLIELVKTYSMEKQIILSTHSDYVLDLLKPENILLVKKDKKTGTVVSQLTAAMSAKNYKALKNYLNVSGNLGEYWRHTGFEDG